MAHLIDFLYNEVMHTNSVTNTPMTSTPYAQKMAPRTILLVEDDAFIFDIYRTKFTQDGHTVLGAHSGEEALKVLADTAHPPVDLILCDVIMPGIGGFGFLQQKYENPAYRDIPTIMLTNVSEKEHYELAEKYGAIGYIVKANYTPSDVLARVARYVYEYEQGKQSGGGETHSDAADVARDAVAEDTASAVVSPPAQGTRSVQ